MNFESYQIWIIISILLFVIEIFAPTFLAMSVGIGCLSSGIVAYFGFDIKIQLIAFSIGTLISFFGVRPVMLKYFHKNSDNVKTNTDALIGRTGRVINTIDNSKNQGRIMIDGDNWRAEAENNEIINEGDQIEVIKVNSTILIVKQITKI